MIDTLASSRANGQMASIYRLIDAYGFMYIGSTTQDIRRRFSQHKSTKNPSRVKFKNWDLVSIELLEKCTNSKRYIIEQKWIDKYRGKHLLNKADAGVGPKNVKRSLRAIESARTEMKSRWKKHRFIMLRRVNAHKTPKFQSMAGRRGAEARIRSLGLVCLINKKTRKKILFRSAKEASLFLRVHPSTVGKYLNGKTKNYSYIFKRLRPEA